MRCLTLMQPWASLLIRGAKQIETRGWRAPYRGPLAIHASRTFNPEQWRMSDREPFASALDGINLHKTLGMVLGTVELVDCLPVEELVGKISDRERAFGNYEAGRWGWVLRNPRACVPVAARGQLAIWEWTPPEGWEDL
jgi:hypothetical protein